LFNVKRLLFKLALLVLIASLASQPLSAGEFNPVLSIGDKAPEWKPLPGVDDRKYGPADFKSRDVLVVVFTCNSCPYAEEYEDRIIRFAKKHVTPDGPVGLVAVNVNTIEEDRLPQMKERAKKKQFPYPYLFDETQQIAKDFGAAFTPEFLVLNKERKVVYMGAFDDNSDATKVKREYITEAVTAALAGRLPEVRETVPVGCLIRMERQRRRKPGESSSLKPTIPDPAEK